MWLIWVSPLLCVSVLKPGSVLWPSNREPSLHLQSFQLTFCELELVGRQPCWNSKDHPSLTLTRAVNVQPWIGIQLRMCSCWAWLVVACVHVCVCVCVCFNIYLVGGMKKHLAGIVLLFLWSQSKNFFSTLKHAVMLRKKWLQNYILGVSIFIHPLDYESKQDLFVWFVLNCQHFKLNLERGEKKIKLFFAPCCTLLPMTKIAEWGWASSPGREREVGQDPLSWRTVLLWERSKKDWKVNEHLLFRSRFQPWTTGQERSSAVWQSPSSASGGAADKCGRLWESHFLFLDHSFSYL